MPLTIWTWGTIGKPLDNAPDAMKYWNADPIIVERGGYPWASAPIVTRTITSHRFSPLFRSAKSWTIILGGLKIPVLSGLTIGHTDDQVTLPEGVMATLDADKKELTIQ